MTTPERIALIIATKDHPKELRRALAFLQTQSVLPDQVIIADGGTSPVEGMAAEFPRLPIIYRRVFPPGLAKQQNAGLKCVDSSVTLVGFLDDDIVLEPGALAAMLEFWRQAPPDVGGAGFNIVNNAASPRAVWVKALFCLDSPRAGVMLPSGYQTRIGAVSETKAVEWLNSGTTVWRRQILDERQFDEWFEGPSHLYDVDFSYGISRRYRLMVVAPAAVREIPMQHRRWDDRAFGRWQIVNRLYFVKKHPELSLPLCYWALIGQTVVNAARCVLERDLRFWQRMRGNLAGWLHVARQRPVASRSPSLRVTARTASRFGYLWERSAGRDDSRLRAYHVDRMQRDLSLPSFHGLVLDAGCGEGIDLANQARQPGVEIVGVELSEGGCRISAARCRRLPSASVVRGDLRQLPFADDTFDFIYSYGVLHHLPEPADGLRELVRVLKPGSPIAVYLYEDFRDRSLLWRGLLAAANACRRLTTAMPPALLYRLCQIGSPVIYTLFTVPSRVLGKIPGCQSVAASMPFRHGTGPFSLVGDLYDRFSTPIERRYAREQALTLLRQAGLEAIRIVNDRGWMVVGTKPLGMPPASDTLASVGRPEAQGYR